MAFNKSTDPEEEKKLDNPVWHAIAETHRHFGIDAENTKFYRPDYCPFGGIIKAENTSAPITEYAALIDNFFIIGEQQPEISDSLQLKTELLGVQMIIYQKINFPITEEIVKLNKEKYAELTDLVNLVQPGYFKNKTMLLGNYYGIIKNGQLIAASGERMQLNKYIEVSAVVTHPDHTGKGYAKQLVSHTVSKIFDQDKIPFLHAAATNTGAIQLYEKLGFHLRRKMSFWNIVR
ncbi:MAG: GNAT family N-acetyltransferase [Ferruginibacter sp.]